MLEVAVPEIVECLDWPKPVPHTAETMEMISDWTLERGQFWNQPENVDKILTGQYAGLHPFKLSHLLSQNATEPRAAFCQRIMPYVHKAPS